MPGFGRVFAEFNKIHSGKHVSSIFSKLSFLSYCVLFSCGRMELYCRVIQMMMMMMMMMMDDDDDDDGER